MSDLAAKLGGDLAAEVAEFENANVTAVQDYINAEKVDCEFVMARVIGVHFNMEQHRRPKGGDKMLASANVEAAKRTFYSPEQYVESVSYLANIRLYMA